MRAIDADALEQFYECGTDPDDHYADMTYIRAEHIDNAPTIEPEVRHGLWIECDYKHMEHGMIETEPKAGLCCSECRTAFQKKKMTYKQYCAACGAKMRLRTPTETQLDEADSVMMGGADNG